MNSGHDAPRRFAPLLWSLLALFFLRVTGQVLVAFFGVDITVGLYHRSRMRSP